MIYQDKSMKTEDVKTKECGPLVCVTQCVMPDFGAWNAGDVVEDPSLVKVLRDHPYFKPKTEDK